ncbi:MAG: hypothetical protein IJ163_00435, partial [Bacteroidaceae bacterium]|nr:hypothetical protein [Bacteroidaceae bacterium]
HSRTALYQGGRIDVRLTYSLRHPGRRRAALSFLFCSSLSMIDFYRSSQFFPKASAKVRPFFELAKYSGDFLKKKAIFLEKRWEGMGFMGGMGADGSYGKGERGQWKGGSNTVAAWMTAFGHADGWARLPAGAIDKRNKEKPSEKKTIRKEKHQKKKKKKAVG